MRGLWFTRPHTNAAEIASLPCSHHKHMMSVAHLYGAAPPARVCNVEVTLLVSCHYIPPHQWNGLHVYDLFAARPVLRNNIGPGKTHHAAISCMSETTQSCSSGRTPLFSRQKPTTALPSSSSPRRMNARDSPPGASTSTCATSGCVRHAQSGFLKLEAVCVCVLHSERTRVRIIASTESARFSSLEVSFVPGQTRNHAFDLSTSVG